MSRRSTAPTCPRCGGTMNHHADKLVAPVNAADEAAADVELGGVLQETHGCPACGNVEFRQPARPPLV